MRMAEDRKRARRCYTQACVRKVAAAQVCVRAYFGRNVGVGFPRSRLLTLHGIELDRSKRAPTSPLSSPSYNLQSNDPRPLQGICTALHWRVSASAFSRAHNTFCQSLTQTMLTTGNSAGMPRYALNHLWEACEDVVANSGAPAVLA